MNMESHNKLASFRDKKAVNRASFTSTSSCCPSDVEYVKAEMEEEHLVNELLRANIQPSKIPVLPLAAGMEMSTTLPADPLMAAALKLSVDCESALHSRRSNISMWDDDDDDSDNDERDDDSDIRSTPSNHNVSHGPGWVSLCALKSSRSGSEVDPVDLEKVLRQSEADEEHIFLTLLKSQKRLNDELESLGDCTTAHSHISDTPSGGESGRLSFTHSPGSLRPLHGSFSAAASSAGEQEDE